MADQAEYVMSLVEKNSGTLAQLSAELDKFFATPYASMEESMSNSSFAKVNLNLAYALNTLYYSTLFAAAIFLRLIASKRKSS